MMQPVRIWLRQIGKLSWQAQGGLAQRIPPCAALATELAAASGDAGQHASHLAGRTFFFTVALLERRRALLKEHVDRLGQAFRHCGHGDRSRSMPSWCRRIICLPLDPADGYCELCETLAFDQGKVREADSSDGAEVQPARIQRRAGNQGSGACGRMRSGMKPTSPAMPTPFTSIQ